MYISGIASGLDTETLIQQLMAIERRPLVLMQERKNTLQQQRDAWRDINTRLNNLRERMADLSRVGLYERRAGTSSAADVATVTANRDAAEARYSITVEQLARSHRVASTRLEEPLGYNGLARVSVGEQQVDILVAADDTVATIADKINDADIAVSARVIDGRLVIEADDTGADNAMTFTDGYVWRQLGILDDAGQIAQESLLQEAQDAKFLVEGLTVQRSSNTIDDLFEGVTLRLHAEGDTVIEVKRDADAVVDAVRRFVDQYNSTMSFMSERSGEGGVLQGDTLLMRIRFQLRSDTTAAVAAGDTLYNQLASVGVTVDRDGVMSLNESRLREALSENPAEVARLFAGSTADGDEFDGVAARLESRFQGWLATGSGLLAERQKMFGDRMRAIDDSMERMERRLEIRERNLMRQFVALEEVLAGFQTQAMWLEGQIQQLNAMAAANMQRRR